jgi:hypothetical protein
MKYTVRMPPMFPDTRMTGGAMWQLHGQDSVNKLWRKQNPERLLAPSR